MSGVDLLCLNRVTKPQVPLEEFLQFTAGLGIKRIEVRNDFTDIGILDGLSDAALDQALSAAGIEILTINALYPFEDGKALPGNLAKLKFLIAEAKRVQCPYIVMCPLNEAGDPRTPAERSRDLVAALNAYGPLFQEAGMMGLIEPLGFEICALRTKKAALAGINHSDYPKCFGLLHDTFHHFLSGETDFYPKQTFMIHVSGVPAGKARPAITDEDRLLVTEADIMDNRGQVAALLAGGCTAPISYEPFSSKIRAQSLAELKPQLQQSIQYLFS
jgi:2-keto-myo-inositol isomerase